MFKCYLFGIAALALASRFVKGLEGGIPAQSNEFPYHVLMKVDNVYFCNGALFNPRHILTTASCTELGKHYRPGGTVTATLGTNYIQDAGITHDIIQHEIYSSFEKFPRYPPYPDIRFSLSIYTLKTSVDSSLHLPVTLPTTDELAVGSNAVVSSMGSSQSEDSFNPHIQKLDVEILNWLNCKIRTMHRIYLQDYQICALAPQGMGVTHRDHGGPLVHNNIIIGVAAQADVSGVNGYPDIYINVFYYKTWIDRIVNLSNYKLRSCVRNTGKFGG